MKRGSTTCFTRGLATVAAAGTVGVAAVMGARAWRDTAGTGPSDRVGEAGGHGAVGAAFAQPAADRLSELIRFQTVSSRHPEEVDLPQFEGFIEALARLFPAVHAALELERVNGRALLFRWRGSDSDPAQAPTVLMAHYDVVPVNPLDDWTHPAFSGHQDGTYVWGRGALDDKGAVVVILAAVESLLGDGFRPGQDIYLSFGDNEETAGDSAVAVAALLRERGVSPWLVLDEGGAVAENVFPGLKPPAAVIGVSEKGILDLQLLTRGAGGHASTPPKMGVTARLARAIMALETHPFPQSMPGPIQQMLETIGRSSGLGLRLVTANMWAFRPLVTRAFDLLGDETRAMTRTTVAVTELEGSKGGNVLASTARATANIRIAVGETVDGVVQRIRRIINDPSVELTVIGGHDASPISRTDNDQFALLTRSVAASYPQAVVTPYIQTGATDSRNFTGICDAVYRFSPLLMDDADRASLHAVNEKVRLASLGAGVVFYRELIRGLR